MNLIIDRQVCLTLSQRYPWIIVCIKVRMEWSPYLKLCKIKKICWKTSCKEQSKAKGRIDGLWIKLNWVMAVFKIFQKCLKLNSRFNKIEIHKKILRIIMVDMLISNKNNIKSSQFKIISKIKLIRTIII